MPQRMVGLVDMMFMREIMLTSIDSKMDGILSVPLLLTLGGPGTITGSDNLFVVQVFRVNAVRPAQERQS